MNTDQAVALVQDLTVREYGRVIRAMREWAADCCWVDADGLDDYSDSQIIAGVNRHYDGGVAAFLEDCEKGQLA